MRLYTLSWYDMVVPDYKKEIQCVCVCMCVCIVPVTCASLAYVSWYKLTNIRTTLLAEFRDGTSRIWKSLTDFNINELIDISLSKGCSYNGQWYTSGDHFPGKESCNKCFCYSGHVTCTNFPCNTDEICTEKGTLPKSCKSSSP